MPAPHYPALTVGVATRLLDGFVEREQLWDRVAPLFERDGRDVLVIATLLERWIFLAQGTLVPSTQDREAAARAQIVNALDTFDAVGGGDTNDLDTAHGEFEAEVVRAVRAWSAIVRNQGFLTARERAWAALPLEEALADEWESAPDGTSGEPTLPRVDNAAKAKEVRDYLATRPVGQAATPPVRKVVAAVPHKSSSGGPTKGLVVDVVVP